MNNKNLVISDGTNKLEAFVNDNDLIVIRCGDLENDTIYCGLCELTTEDTKALIKELNHLLRNNQLSL
jgi:hypothetical protein